VRDDRRKDQGDDNGKAEVLTEGLLALVQQDEIGLTETKQEAHAEGDGVNQRAVVKRIEKALKRCLVAADRVGTLADQKRDESRQDEQCDEQKCRSGLRSHVPLGLRDHTTLLALSTDAEGRTSAFAASPLRRGLAT
jgi:hypothetical protein